MKRSLFALLSLVLLGGCNTDLPLPVSSGERKIVLLGELTANDTMFIRAGQSVLIQNSGAKPPLIRELQVTVSDRQGINTALLERLDVMSDTLFTVPFSSAAFVKAGDVYQISANHPQLGMVKASVAIPKPFTASLKGIGFTTYNGDSVLQFDIDISDANAASAFYVLEVIQQSVLIKGYFTYNGRELPIKDNEALYNNLKSTGTETHDRYDTVYVPQYSRREFYTSDAQSDNAGGSLDRIYKRVFLQGKNFGGILHNTHMFIPQRAIYGQSGQLARTIVCVKSVAADYFTYLKGYDQYDPSSGSSGDAAPANLEGNVQGGFGMVGGVFRWQTSVLY